VNVNLDCNFENADSLGAKSSGRNLKSVISIHRLLKYVDGDKRVADDLQLIGCWLPMEWSL